MAKELTINTAKTYVQNYKGVSDPNSLSYNDGHAWAWLEDQAKRYGYPRPSTMNSACRLFLRHNKPAPKNNGKLRIEVIKFMGKFGAFANYEQIMYRAEIVGVNGKRHGAGDGMDDGMEGNPDPQYAKQDAKEWSALLGCPIVSVDKTAQVKAKATGIPSPYAKAGGDPGTVNVGNRRVR
jgi:hypothetical protein